MTPLLVLGIALILANQVEVNVDDIAIGSRPIAVQLQLDGKTKPPKARLQAEGRELPLAPMLTDTMLEGSVEGVVDLVLDLSTTGASPGAMLDALDGELLLMAVRGPLAAPAILV